MNTLIKNLVMKAHEAKLRLYLARSSMTNDHYGFFIPMDRESPVIGFYPVRGGRMDFFLNHWSPSVQAGTGCKIYEASSVTAQELSDMLYAIPPSWASLPDGWSYTGLDDYLRMYSTSRFEPVWLDGPWPYVACRLERDGWCQATPEEKNEAARLMGLQAAQEHQDEYPGEEVIGDWDSEWWSTVTPDILHPDADPDGDLWEIFHETLVREVTRLTDKDVVY